MSKTKYIKVAVSERLPEKEGKYLARVFHYSNFELYEFSSGEFRTSFLIDEWMEEVSDREQEMKEMLEECRLQLEYLNKAPDNRGFFY
ncbi:MAG: hypothetical protein L0G02_08155, partial [Lactococcus lactis]|nr:hypothetical protein [Lactococcus lactis]